MSKPIDFCRSFQHEACKVWQDMSDAEQFGVPRNEETTTEELLLRLARKHQGRGLSVKTYTKKEEAATGSDWAFWFSDPNRRGIGARIQAKRLFSPSGRYESLFHQSDAQKNQGGPTPNQCQTMLEHQDGLVPIYIFYNSEALLKSPPSAFDPYWCKWYWPFYYFGLPAWGISAASGLAVKQANWGKNNKPDDFFMAPWHCLVCEECWDVTATDKSLPELVSHGLKELFEARRGDVEADIDLQEYKISFELTENLPNWVRLLTDGGDERERLTSEMQERGLRGVAVLAQTDERLD